MYQSCVVVTSLVACSSYEALRCEATRGGESRRRQRVETPQRGVRNTTRGGLGPTRVTRRQKRRGASSPGTGAQSPVERPEEEQRIPCRRKASWTGKGFVGSRRRGRSGLGGFHRVGRARTAKNAQRRHRVEFATGASEARSHGHVGQGHSPGRGKNTPPRRSRDPLKRSVRRETHGSPVSVGGIPLSARPGKTR